MKKFIRSMKKFIHQYKKLAITAVILIEIAIVCFLMWPFIIINEEQEAGITATEFAQKAAVTRKEDRMAADIWLLQTIHKTDGIDYRYAVETDCHKGEFKTKYVSSTPIEWVDETSAVEVIMYDVQVRFDGTMYASGQYYTVPLLGGISSEAVSLDEWQENLIKKAYQAYVSDIRLSVDMIFTEAEGLVLRLVICAVSITLSIFLICYISDGKRKTKMDGIW